MSTTARTVPQALPLDVTYLRWTKHTKTAAIRRVARTVAGVRGLSEPTFRGFHSLQVNVAFASLGNIRYNKRRHSLLYNDAVSTAYVARRVALSNTGTCTITCLGQLRKTTVIVTNSAIGLKIPAGRLLNTADMQNIYNCHPRRIRRALSLSQRRCSSDLKRAFNREGRTGLAIRLSETAAQAAVCTVGSFLTPGSALCTSSGTQCRLQGTATVETTGVHCQLSSKFLTHTFCANSVHI